MQICIHQIVGLRFLSLRIQDIFLCQLSYYYHNISPHLLCCQFRLGGRSPLPRQYLLLLKRQREKDNHTDDECKLKKTLKSRLNPVSLHSTLTLRDFVLISDANLMQQWSDGIKTSIETVHTNAAFSYF